MNIKSETKVWIASAVVFALSCSLCCWTFSGVNVWKVMAGITVDDKVGSVKEPELPSIVIDAGHGGEDGGTQSADGVLEKDINLQISLKLNSLLKVMGYNTVMTRQQDKLIYDESCTKMRQKKVSDINNRLEIAKSYPDSLFISIHQNYFTESKYSGAQVFYSPNNEESAVLAQSIQQNVCSLLQKENSRKIKKSGSEIFLLDNIKSPAVMVECGFMSNADEALKLTDEEYQKKMALAIASGINNYLSKS